MTARKYPVPKIEQTHPPGHFTALMRHPRSGAVVWPPSFESHAWDRASGAHQRAKPQRGAANGFDRVELGLPGAKVHTARWKNDFMSAKP